MERRRRRRALVAAALAAALSIPSPARGAANPIAAENALPGDAGWRLRQPARQGELEGYAAAASVDLGEAVGIHARADAPRTLTWSVYRMGWYGGAEGRLVASGGPVPVGPQPTPAPTATGLVACAWPEAFRVQAGPSWTSGVHLVVLTRDDGPQAYVVLVVRDDARKGAAVVQASVTTWQAYNRWGGKSLYAGGPAREVSFDRPYLEGHGAGQYFRYEHPFVTWAESRGLDLVYVTNVDLDRDPGLLLGQRLFLSVGHDEYWTRPARDAVEAAVASGTSAAFLSSNAVYWQIRLEPSGTTGAPRRTQVCWKGASASDPLAGTPLETTLWRNPPVNAPENALLGVMYTAWLLADGAWVVKGSGHWLYEGTGLLDGDAFPRLVGYETDRRVGNGAAPPGLEVVARSPVLDTNGNLEWHEAVVRETPAGGFFFAAGTMAWSWGLGHPALADPRVQRMAENLFRRAGLEPALPAPPAAPPPALEVRADGIAAVETFAGVPFVEGLRDGPAAEALFRRPVAAAVDADGNVFVADAGNHAVRMIRSDAGRTVLTIAGNGTRGTALGPGASARLALPSGISVGPDGSVFVADTGNERILRLRREAGGGWVAERLAGADGVAGLADGLGDEARFARPSGLAFVAGWLHVADRGNHAIRRVDAAGLTETVAGGGGERGHRDGAGRAARFDYPTDLAADGDGLAVVDAASRVIRHVALPGAEVTTVAGPRPGGYESGGFADGEAADARFMTVGGIVSDGAGLLVADAGNARVRRVRDGRVATAAGTGVPGSTDGPAREARLAMPTGLAPLGAAGWLVVDHRASVLRRLVPGTDPPPGGLTSGPGGGPGGGCGCGSAGGAGALAAGLARLVARRRRS